MGTYTTEKDQVSYSLGVNIATSLKNQGFEDLNLEAITTALSDVFNNKTLQINEEAGGQILNTYFQAMQTKKHSKNIEEGAAFLKANATKPDVITLPSGLQYKVLVEGSGAKPSASDKVTTHYHGTLINGTVFDSSVERGQPATFPVNGVIAGWIEALQLMPTGSKWQLYVPSNLAYGERGASELIGPNTTLIFDVELLSIN
ncbi:FKBP-type peptidyl-prolyl cis-trans isomerase [uncultured Cytophaga sp.]|uniref:FKBP-type peptidyl-prolyl cis-trans isomerase n=1 Tax=uncultured Cytophaga sp. TaxID=160238 RepID=UPI00261B046F|nr:FKBP-type peptidyl-prolyl cis-trans isomerase [uncultured Cytophaga sp.]